MSEESYKLKQIILIIVTIIFYSFPSFSSEIEGKGLICSKSKEYEYADAIFFYEKDFERWLMSDAVDNNGNPTNFNFIKLRTIDPNSEFNMDRPYNSYTLLRDDRIVLNFKNWSRQIIIIDRYSLEYRHDINGELHQKKNCEVINDKKSFLKKMKEISLIREKSYKDKLSKRKI